MVRKKKKSMFGAAIGKVRTYSNIKRKRVTPKADLEAAVQKEVLQRARQLGIPLWRQNAGNIHCGDLHMVLAPAGAADLTGMIPNSPGRRLEVECKRRVGGVQSYVQKDWQADMERLSVIYLIVTSGEDFEEQIRKYFYIHGQHYLPSSIGMKYYETRDAQINTVVPKRAQVRLRSR